MSTKHFDINVRQNDSDRTIADVYPLTRTPGADTWSTDTSVTLASVDITDFTTVFALGEDPEDGTWYGTDDTTTPEVIRVALAPTIERLRTEAGA